MSQMGFHVISACYSSEGAARLKGEVALAVVCDVTKEEDIANLVSQTSKLLSTKKLKLWGLVCNAGCVYSLYTAMPLLHSV
jgi:NAD(P)-dependent dehydrogenase (short-subunit alcohol dehydrogenase family)